MRIEMTPRKVEVEIPGYGKFDIMPLGAGAEAEIRVAFREMNEALEESEKYKPLAEREGKEKLDKESEEYKAAMAAFARVSTLADRAKSITYEKMRGVFHGKNVEKLFNDFTYHQIQEIYRKAIDEDGRTL